MDARKYRVFWWLGGGLVLALLLLAASLLLDESAPELTDLLPKPEAENSAEAIAPERQMDWARWDEMADGGLSMTSEAWEAAEQAQSLEPWRYLPEAQRRQYLDKFPPEFWEEWRAVARGGGELWIDDTAAGYPWWRVSTGVRVAAWDALLREDWQLAAQRTEELLLTAWNDCLSLRGDLWYVEYLGFDDAGVEVLRALLREPKVPGETLRKLRANLGPAKISEAKMAQLLKGEFARKLVWNDPQETLAEKFEEIENKYFRVGPNYTFENYRWAVFPKFLAVLPRSLLYKPHATQRLAAGFYRELLQEEQTLEKIKAIREEVVQATWGRSFTQKVSLNNFIGKTVAVESLYSAATARQWHLSFMARLSAAEAGLALREYESARGKLPERLEELVPEYLPAVPVDFTDGQPVRYSPRLRAVWICGEDGLQEPPKEPGDANAERNVFRLPPSKTE